MNKMEWKYGHVYAECKCKKPIMVNFTTLTPMYNPITAKNYKYYHENINLAISKLAHLGFINYSVMLINHQDISKKKIENILGVDIE